MHRSPGCSLIARRFFSNTASRREAVSLAFQRHDSPDGSSTGPPILLMHGLFGSQRNNRTMSKVLAKDLARPVYTLDLRNHGDSPHSPQHDYTVMSEDVEHFIQRQGIKKPTLIGHSMGAKVAMTMALRQPSLYSGICPVDNSPIDAALKSDFGTYVNAMKEVENRKASKQSEADQILQKYDIELTIRQFLLTNFVRQRDGSYAFRVPLTTLAKSLPAMADFPYRDPDEARYEGPTLFVRGTESHYIADDTLPLIGRFFPKFELLSFKCGHWVMSERFEEFKQGFVEWVHRCVDERDDK